MYVFGRGCSCFSNLLLPDTAGDEESVGDQTVPTKALRTLPSPFPLFYSHPWIPRAELSTEMSLHV